MFVVATHIVIALAIFHVSHEIGHLLCAKIFKFRIIKIGFALKPIPHTFVHVSINNSKVNNLRRKIYYLSGFFVNVSLLFVYVVSTNYHGWARNTINSLCFLYTIHDLKPTLSIQILYF